MASGDTLLILLAANGAGPVTDGATFDTRNQHPVLDFDAITDETKYFEFVLPRNYSGGGITLTLFWMASTATTGTVDWEGAFERHEADVTDLDADSFAAAQSTIDTTASASGELVETEIAFTNSQIDGLLAGESGRLSIMRDADGGTMAGDAELFKIEARET